MRTVLFSVFRGFAPLTGTLFVLVCGACIFSPSTTKLPVFPVAETTPYDSVTTAPMDIVVELYEPYLDRRLGAGGQTNLAQAYPVRVRERESGRIVEYRFSRRGYGSWSEERERQLHLFLLRSFFFYPGVYDDSTGSGNLDSLYARARVHDPYTRRVDSAGAEEYRRLSRTTVRPRVLGIQVRVNDAGDSLYLELVAPGSPADKAGLRRGMPVLAVNDSSVTGDSASARFVRFIAADTVTTVLTVGTSQGPRREVVGRDTASFPTVQVDSLGGAGYIAIYSFMQSTVHGGSTHDEFKKALDATRHFPSTVLDLRDNG
jgi:C-terminal processing protease CtpA/Prc